MSHHFARIYGELVLQYIAAGDSENAAILARRAFHHAAIVWHQNLTR